MKKRNFASSVTIVAAFLAACGGSSSEPAPSTGASTFQHFGFAAVDCGYDDPLDQVNKTAYLDEVAAFSSTAHMCVATPDDLVQTRLTQMANQKMGAFLAIQPLLYDSVSDANTGSGRRLRLRADYAARWAHFVQVNNLQSQASKITALYLADEPAWNGMSAADLQAGADLVKASMPSVPVAVIEAAPALSALQIPASVDWIGFDHYAVPEPDTNATYLSELALLKSKRTRAGQKILLVMDAQWLPLYGQAGYQDADMKSVATSYARLADKERADVVGMLGYLWPGGLDDPAQKGARELPASVIAEYSRIGKRMTGKP